MAYSSFHRACPLGTDREKQMSTSPLTTEVVLARTKMYYEDWCWQEMPEMFGDLTPDEYAEEICDRVMARPYSRSAEFDMNPAAYEFEMLQDIPTAIDEEIERFTTALAA